MTRNDNNPIAPGEHVTGMLTAYIDGTLEPEERGQVRAHLEGCDACKAEYAEILATRSMLRAVPAMQAPRSFTLTPEMARKVRPPSLFERIFNPDNSPGFALGSVLSFVVLFFVVVVPAVFSQQNTTFSTIGFGLSGDGGSMAYESAPSNKQQDQDARTMGAQAEATATTGAAAASAPEVQALAPQGTPVPSNSQPPTGAGGGVLPEAVPTEAAGIGTTAGAESATTMAEAPADTTLQTQPPAASRQAEFYSPPVDWGAAIMGALPLFLLALGLALAVMSWIARRSRPT